MQVQEVLPNEGLLEVYVDNIEVLALNSVLDVLDKGNFVSSIPTGDPGLMER